MGRDPLRLVKQLELRLLGRRMPVLGDHAGIDRFQVLGQIPGQNAVSSGIVPDEEVVGLERFVALQQLHHLAHVADAHMERVTLEGLVENLAGLGQTPRPHREQPQGRAGLGLAFREAHRLAIAPFGEVEFELRLGLPTDLGQERSRSGIDRGHTGQSPAKSGLGRFGQGLLVLQPRKQGVQLGIGGKSLVEQ